MLRKSIREMVLEHTEVSMSIPQFNAYKKGEMTLEQIVDYNKAEKQINKWLSHPKIFKQATVLVAAMMMLETKVMAFTTEVSGPMEKMRVLTDRVMEVVYIIQMAGFIICLIMGLIEMIKAILNKDLGSIVAIAIKYFIGLTALFVFPFALRMIVELLGQPGGLLW